MYLWSEREARHLSREVNLCALVIDSLRKPPPSPCYDFNDSEAFSLVGGVEPRTPPLASPPVSSSSPTIVGQEPKTSSPDSPLPPRRSPTSPASNPTPIVVNTPQKHSENLSVIPRYPQSQLRSVLSAGTPSPTPTAGISRRPLVTHPGIRMFHFLRPTDQVPDAQDPRNYYLSTGDSLVIFNT